MFAWNLRSLDTPFARRSLALNAIEKGRAWHWRLLPAGWANPSFIFQQGQIKTKQAFATFFPDLCNGPNEATQANHVLYPAYTVSTPKLLMYTCSAVSFVQIIETAAERRAEPQPDRGRGDEVSTHDLAVSAGECDEKNHYRFHMPDDRRCGALGMGGPSRRRS